MMCEICGRPIKGKGREIFVESATLTVCQNCARYGTAVQKKPVKSSRKPTFHRKTEDYEVIDEYPDVVRRERERKGLTQKELARTINEKESVIHRVETGHMRPSRNLARKLEGALDITLIEKVSEPEVVHTRRYSDELTIGDIIRIKKRKA
ncbi:MAG: TIGR00270 family protein [Theionarchaea archaeon]|nr:TIGR00270 family protein [Theionarchaea archaeon]